MCAGIGSVKGVVIEAIGDDFFAYFDGEFVEGFAIVFDGDFEGYLCEKWGGVEVVAEFLEVFGGNGHLGVDAFVREVDTAENAKFAPLFKEFVS